MSRTERPNLLFIMMDQLRADALGCYGNAVVETPNLDRLAAAGTVFTHHYCTAVSCTPSKGAILTGVHPHNHGAPVNNLHLSPDVQTLPEHLDDPAYRTAFMGMWHLGDELYPQRGFQTRVSMEDRYNRFFSPGRDRSRRSDYHEFLVANGHEPDTTYHGEPGFSRTFAARLPEAYSKPAFLADRARAFLAEAGDQPFVLYTSFLEPHTPYHSVLDAYYDRAAVPVPATYDHLFDDRYPLWYRLRQRQRSAVIEAQGGIRDVQARYLGMVSLVDRHVGRILAALEELGQADRTVVVVTSDHGDMMGDHGMLAKGVIFEGATRVPLMVRVPWLEQPARVTTPVSQIHVVPTLLELLTGAVPGGLPAASLVPLLGGAAQELTDAIVIEWESRARPDSYQEFLEPGEADFWREVCVDSARTLITRDGWKLAVHARGDQGLLHHLTEDPLELENRYHDPEYRPVAERLLARLQAWQRATGDDTPLALPGHEVP